MPDEALRLLLDYDRRRYRLKNGWRLRFRIWEVAPTPTRPHGIRCSFTLHDADRTMLLGFENAHGLALAQTSDHRHRFRRSAELVSYVFRGAGDLICDFFAAVEAACVQEGVAFTFEDPDIDLESEGYHDEDISG